ncbi:NUDIX domain-containing protein [Alicyclobacillus macrosporangiidus]|uniref:8-oxo-dGTP diphosphatase n=1 Tax=Alicyclobacillus macrosporangiidus TaxID=392015 RepID=A0A1I7K1P9_9BACL|nr:NUDIX domain-containing protein [Alicyclobacillus macrosporangiidus]SFU91331.1 8-oxo-dGTP diphosphatase [Alicyclobacillus macrosporangiidus]
MLIIVNCFAQIGGRVVMLQKPRRGWWVLPGGKVEPFEAWPEAARREMWEEAGLRVDGLRLRGVHLLRELGPDGEQHRLIAQFSADSAEGQLREVCTEGTLALIPPEDLARLPMDEGDRVMIRHTLWACRNGADTVFFGNFTYTADRDLLDWRMQPDVQGSAIPVEGRRGEDVVRR